MRSLVCHSKHFNGFQTEHLIHEWMNRMEWNGMNGDTFHEMLYVGVTFNLGQHLVWFTGKKSFFFIQAHAQSNEQS